MCYGLDRYWIFYIENLEMGRNKLNIPMDSVLEMMEEGWDDKEIAAQVGVSIPTLKSRINELQGKESLTLQYRGLQNIELTSLQADILSNITSDKMEKASLRDLTTAFKILKDKELVDTGRPTEIKGMVGYLLEIERKQKEDPEVVEVEDVIVKAKEVEDIDYTEVLNG